MSRVRKISLNIFTVFFLIISSFSGIATFTDNENTVEANDIYQSGIIVDNPQAVTVSNSNPFFALIATPIAVHYEGGVKEVIPLYVKDSDNPSSAVVRAEEEQIKIISDFVISDIYSAKEASIIAASIWESSDEALIIKEDSNGYELGVAAAPIASYKNIPIYVTEEIDTEIIDSLNDLGVTHIYLCGDLQPGEFDNTSLENIDQIMQETISIIENDLSSDVEYITITNPRDALPPEVLDSQVVIDLEDQTVPSNLAMPTQSMNIIKGGLMKYHPFTLPSDYKYARVKVDLENLDYQYAEELGDTIALLILSPEGPAYYFAGSEGGNPARDQDGNLLEDNLHFEFTVYNQAGPDNEYNVRVYGKWYALKEGHYNLKVTIEKLEHPYVPLMEQLSTLAPYLTAYHKGIIYAKTELAFAANDDILYEGQPVKGTTQPGNNEFLLEPSNQHTMQIHDELNAILADIADIPTSNIPALRQHYADNPVYVTLVGDPSMIPMYFYKNPDNSNLAGLALPSDYIYGDIDVNKTDPENNTETYWPYQENMVGRITGRGPQDASALIARTIFYDEILDNMENQQWKDTALVQTGCGLEFQNVPILTKLFSHGEEPTKFPSGESEFINLRLKSKMATGYDNPINTFWLQSQREGFTEQQLELIKNSGFLNKLLFPKNKVYFLSSDKKVTGGQDQMNSNLIFTFAHGSHQLFEHGDVFIDRFGIPGVTTMNRWISKLRSGLSTKGSYNVRGVDGMEYGPSIIFVESCITARTDGMMPENVLSQAFIHAGVNTYIGATRFTADPGYLPPRPLKNGVGFGILGLAKAFFDLTIKGEYPQAHFGAVIAEDFILSLINDDSTTGIALREAKNLYLDKDANETFLWTPPLAAATGIPEVDQELYDAIENSVSNEETRHLGKKYVALHEFNIYGDPAFNPYQSVNEG